MDRDGKKLAVINRGGEQVRNYKLSHQVRKWFYSFDISLESCLNYYHPQRSCGKVMFLHLSEILFTGRCLADIPPRQTPPGQRSPWADTSFSHHFITERINHSWSSKHGVGASTIKSSKGSKHFPQKQCPIPWILCQCIRKFIDFLICNASVHTYPTHNIQNFANRAYPSSGFFLFQLRKGNSWRLLGC